ncbi:MAG: exo-alpha-sialidase [Draconibacterium sp.]|nr:exo-alpha-sialidase [Draconibacterium sp.]
MKKLIYLLFIFASFYSCEMYPEPGSQNIESFSFNIIGNQQTADAGEYLVNKIGAQIYLESLVPKTDKKFRIELEIISGNGSVDNTLIEADNQGKMVTSWKLGNETNVQQIKAKIFDSSNQFYSEFEIQATAFFLDKWNTITDGFLIGIGDMVKDTINNRSMIISGMDLYAKEGVDNKFYEWKQIQGYGYPNNFKDLEINSKGEVFGGGWNGNLYKSTDWGKTWTLISKPIPENQYNFELTITKDDYIWANKWDYGVYCSKDNGITWTKDTIGLDRQEQLGRIFTFDDSLHLAISHANLTILKTSDDGITWSPINTPEYSLTMFVTDDNAIIAQNQGGFVLHKSTNGGQSYRQVFSPHVEYGTTSWHCYDKFKNNYYVLAPGGGVWRTKSFEEFENLITFSLQHNLFIDHNGTIYASGYKYSNATDDPTLVLSFKE